MGSAGDTHSYLTALWVGHSTLLRRYYLTFYMGNPLLYQISYFSKQLY